MYRGWLRGLGVALTMAVLLVAAPAQAHDFLVGSTPESGATLDTAPSQVSLEFNVPIGERFAQVAVVGPDGTTFQTGEPVVDGPMLIQSVDSIPPGSEVTISYRVVSSDGHPIGGTVPFTVAQTATAAGADAEPAADAADAPADSAGAAGDEPPTTQDEVSTAATTSPDEGGGPLIGWLVMLFVAAATIAGVVTFVVARRRRDHVAEAA